MDREESERDGVENSGSEYSEPENEPIATRTRARTQSRISSPSGHSTASGTAGPPLIEDSSSIPESPLSDEISRIPESPLVGDAPRITESPRPNTSPVSHTPSGDSRVSSHEEDIDPFEFNEAISPTGCTLDPPLNDPTSSVTRPVNVPNSRAFSNVDRQSANAPSNNLNAESSSRIPRAGPENDVPPQDAASPSPNSFIVRLCYPIYPIYWIFFILFPTLLRICWLFLVFPFNVVQVGCIYTAIFAIAVWRTVCWIWYCFEVILIEPTVVYVSWRVSGLADTGLELEPLRVFFKEEPFHGEFWLLWTVGLFGFFQLAKNVSPKSPNTEMPSVRIEILGARLK